MVLTVKLIFAILVAGTGSGFQHGYSIGVVNAPKHILDEWIKDVYGDRGGDRDSISEHFITGIWELAVSLYCAGGIVGGLTTGLFATHIGRRGGLIVNNLFAIIAGILMGLSKTASSPELLIVGRIFAGFNNGLNSGLCGMYLVEISSKSMRGAIGSVYQLILTMAILLSQVLGMEFLLGTDELWPILFGLIAPVGLIQSLLLLLCPESPTYVFAKKGDEKCQNVLKWLRGTDDVAGEVAEIKAESIKEAQTGKATLKQMWQQKVLRKPLIICSIIMLAQQLSGINGVMYYSTTTFTEAGFTISGAQVASLCMGAMNVLMTVVSLLLVDLAGRKTLLVAGFGSMFFVTVFLTVSLSLIKKVTAMAIISVVLVVLFVVCFASGPGSIPWFLVAEFFTQDARPLAASVAVSVNWIANFIVGQTFLTIQSLIGPLVFIIFAFFQFVFTVCIIILVPETKGKTYEEIAAHFQ